MNNNYAKYLLNKVVGNYNSIAEEYSRVREKGWKEMDFLFDKYLENNDAVLDLGCGNGRFYPSFAKKGVRYFGVDPSLKLIEIARRNHPSVDFEAVSSDSLSFSDNYFDKIYSIAVLHHIPSRELRSKFLRDAGRVLKPEGYLILTVWNLKEKIEKNNGFFKWFKRRKLDKKDVLLPWYGSKDTYFHCFNLEELIQLVKESGFSIVEKGEILVGKRPYSNFYIVAKK